ncbi:MBL fold metallo-hydrolase [Candidatus Bathyarchaeota archaeon]|nr:MBL fold metallo-hydrolase [Candidatus Bathyarchaeota archaeon]
MKITDRVYLAGGAGFGYSAPGDCNVYLIDGGDELALVDTGGGNGVEDILRNVRGMGFDPGKISVVFSTHCHFDHIGGNHAVKEATGCRIVAHEADKESIEARGELALYDMALIRGLRFEAEKVDEVLNDGDTYLVGDVSLDVIHTPGHTPGCMSLLMKENEKRSIFCGDVAGANGRLGFINGPGFNLGDWKRSIRKLVSLRPDRLYPGHNTFLLDQATDHLKVYDQKMNAAWTTIVTEVG